MCFGGLNIIETWEAKNAKGKDDAREKKKKEEKEDLDTAKNDSETEKTT